MSQSALLTHGWLSRQPIGFQAAVLASGELLKAPPGQAMFSIGDPPGGVYAVRRGEVAVEIAPTGGGPLLAHVAGPGSWLGEISFLTGEPRRITYRTVVASDLFHLPLEAMEALTRNDSAAMRRFAQISAFNFDMAFRKVEILLDPDSARRIAATLVQCLGEQTSGLVTLSQADLGRMANVSRNTVVRILREFARRSWVRTGYGRVEILNLGALARYLRGE